MLQNLLDKYISFVNKKPLNNIFKWLMFAWVIFLSFLYYYYDGRIGLWFLFLIISLLIYFALKKIVVKIIGIKFFQKKFFLKVKYILLALPLFACLTANLFLLTSAKNALFKITPLNDFLFYELNIIQKIFSSYLFYLLMTFLVYALGRKILKIAGFNFDSGLEKFVFSVGTGFIPFMFTIYFIALAGWLYAWVIWLIIAIFFIFSLSETKKIISETEKTDMDISFNSSWKIYKNIIIFILLIIFASMIAANFKPVATDGDDLHTYYNAPYLYTTYHQFKPLRHYEGANMGQNTEMIYAAIMSTLGSRYIMHFSLFSFLLISLGIYSMFKKIFGDRFATLGLITISLVPWNSYLLTTIKTDFFLSFYLLLLVYLFYLWQNNNFKNKYLYLIGILTGVSFGIKYNAIFIIIPIYLAFLATIIINKKSLLKYLKPLLISAILAIVMFSPWGIKNQIFFNNILYPLEFFQKNTKNLNGLKVDQISLNNRLRELEFLKFSYYDNKILGVNFLKTIWDRSFNKGMAMPIFNNIGPVPLLIIPFYFLLLKNKKILPFLFISIFSVLIWYFAGANGRTWYMYFTILLLCAMLPYLLEQNKKLAFFFLALAFLKFVTITPYYSEHNNFYLMGIYNGETYKSSIPYFQVINYINGLNLQNDEKILFTRGPGFVERNDELTILDNFLSKTGSILEKGDIYFKKTLAEASIKYIYISGDTWELCDDDLITAKLQEEYSKIFQRKMPLICEDLINLKKFLTNYSELIYSNDNSEFYNIKN